MYKYCCVHCVWSVQEAIPPMMSFHVGSLGFLTHFVYENYQQDIRRVIEGNVLLKSVRIHLALGETAVTPLYCGQNRTFKARVYFLCSLNNIILEECHTFLASEQEQFNFSRVFRMTFDFREYLESRRTLPYVQCLSHHMAGLANCHFTLH